MDEADASASELTGAFAIKPRRSRQSGGSRAAVTEPATVAPAHEGAALAEAMISEAVAAVIAETVQTTTQETPASAPAELKPAQERATHGMETMMKTAEDMMAFGQGNFEALIRSGQIWATGVQDLSKQMAATAQASLDETMTSFKALGGVKSVKDAIDLQAQFARAAMEKTVAETGRLTDASLKLAEQAMAPITARVTLAVETMVKPA